MAGSGVFPKTSSGSGGTDLIYKNDYNTIQTAVAAVKTTYYGVACTSSQLGSGSTIIPNITEWNNLRADINSCYKHITGSDSAIGSKTSGQVISATNTNAYKTNAEYIETNKNTVYGSTQLSFMSNQDSSTRSTGWNSAITYAVRVTFASTADAGYFFNTGGSFSLYTTATGGSGGTKNTNWKTAIDSVGAYTYTRADYAAGNKTNTYNVTSYSSSALTVSVTKESATSLLFTAYFNDATGGDPDEQIDLTITSALSYYKSVDAIVSPVPSAITRTSDLTSGGLAPVAAYAFGTIPTSINEGSAGTINVNTTNVADSTTLYWTVTNAGDFGTSIGNFVVNSNAGSFTVTPTSDSTTEGAETFTVSIRTGSTGGTVVATSSAITINDTSVGAASYSFGTIPTSIDEGASGTFNVNTTNVSDSTTLYWTIASNAGDFGTTSGSFVINSNAGSFSVSPTSDVTTEGSETFTVAIRTGSISGSVVATSGSVTINDTSLAPTYTFGTIPTSINEGSAGTINVNTANVPNGTTLYWTVTNAGDFGGASGSFSITTNQGQFPVTPTADSTTEGAETFTVSIRTGSTSGTVVATSSAITINDTSTTPPSATAALSDPFIESNYNAGLGATSMQAWSEVAFLTTGTLRQLTGDNGALQTYSIISGQWLTTSPTAVSTTTAGLFDIELAPTAATLAIDGDNTTSAGPSGTTIRTYSTGSSWNTRLQLGVDNIFRYLLVEYNDGDPGGNVNHNETAYFTATIYLHGTNTVQTSSAITLISSAGSIGV